MNIGTNNFLLAVSAGGGVYTTAGLEVEMVIRLYNLVLRNKHTINWETIQRKLVIN